MSPIRLKRFFNIATFIFCVILALSDKLTLSAPKMDHRIKPRDLALIIPKDQAHSVPAFRQGVKFGILPQSYFNKISRNPSYSIELRDVESNKGVKIDD